MAQRNSNRPRGGGVQKRRTTPTAPAGKGPRSSTRPPPLKWLRVFGLSKSKAASNEGGGRADLVAFLERKASGHTSEKRAIRIRRSRIVGEYVQIGVAPEDVEHILKLNRFTFAGAELRIDELSKPHDEPSDATPKVSTEAQETKEILQKVLAERYDPNKKLLQLSALNEDAGLLELGMFETRDAAIKTFRVLMLICDGLFKTAKDKQNAIGSISLASNNIDNVTQVETVARTFSDLEALDLSNNQLHGTEGIQAWKGRLRSLKTLYVQGNPLEAAEPDYQAKLLDWFPKLQDINGIVVRTPEQIAEASRPNTIPQKGPDFRDVGGVGEGFLLDFFAAYDSDRPGLLAKYYDEESQFSLAVDMNSVRDPAGTASPPWTTYMKFSRNLLKVGSHSARAQRLFKGANLIGELWKTLPPTQHPNIKDELSKYIMDCHLLPGLPDPSGVEPKGVDGLVISVHGEFVENHPQTGAPGKRSFSRNFVLGPGQPGRNSIRVVSDLLSLRYFNPLPNVIGSPATSTNNQEQLQKAAIVSELSKQTGMTAQYSEVCLTDARWDPVAAMALFNDKKASLPPEAFQVVPS